MIKKNIGAKHNQATKCSMHLKLIFDSVNASNRKVTVTIIQVTNTTPHYYITAILKCSLVSSVCMVSLIIIKLRFQFFVALTERIEQVPFSMAVENVELMHECCP